MCYTHPFAMSYNIKLACVRYTVSVHPEPGSNSQKIQLKLITQKKKKKGKKKPPRTKKVYHFKHLFSQQLIKAVLV